MAASGGTIMPQKTGQKDDMKLGIEGKSLSASPRPPEKETMGGVSIEVTSPPSSSRPSSGSTGNTSTDFGEPVGSLQLPPEAMGVLETVINMNRTLETQIDALRLKIDVDAKHSENEKKKIITDKEKVIRGKQTEIELLKTAVRDREHKIKELENVKEERDSQILSKIEEIDELRTLVTETEDYAEELSRKVHKLKDEKKHLENNGAYKEQNEEIRRLKHELVSVKDKLNTMEKELHRARTIVEKQSHRIKVLELEKSDMSSRFREELEKASRAMRQEVERMREVMRVQYEEMRTLREQNTEISNDVRDIKDLLIRNSKTPREAERGPISIQNYGNASKNQLSVRASVPSYKSSSAKEGLPPLTREQTSSKWVPAGTRRINAYSAKQKKQ
ncbi:chromosome partition protein Smc-like [Saccostrea echinata]|uniref:chromosome partition protein Smc-like n=1 Tax=Saccostrea echinata TaxID=191078 RepID=UPI002A81EE9C|nr:chromosome partition protein Smc-like [Saccostrea echinata]